MPYRVTITYHAEEHTGRPAAAVYEELLGHVVLADALGFDALWLAEHHFGAQDGVGSQPLLLALAAALRTRRIKVGTSLIVLPLHHPLHVAEQLATLDALTGGRLSIGFGSGSAPHEFAGFGVEIADGDRLARFRESLELLAAAWSGESFSFHGQFFDVPDARLVPRPARPLREFAWLGAMSAPTAALAGQLGYGLQLPRGRSASDYRETLDAYRGALCPGGHAHADARISIARMIYVGADDETARRDVADSVVQYYLTTKGAVPGAPPPPADELLERLHFIVGGPEHCLREICALGAATGMTHLSMQPLWRGLDIELSTASLRRFGEQILPCLRTDLEWPHANQAGTAPRPE